MNKSRKNVHLANFVFTLKKQSLDCFALKMNLILKHQNSANKFMSCERMDTHINDGRFYCIFC